jgi:hypothetical protein
MTPNNEVKQLGKNQSNEMSANVEKNSTLRVISPPVVGPNPALGTPTLARATVIRM